MYKTRNALIAGASGLVGGHCLRLLLESDRYSQVISIGRRDVPLIHPKLDQQVIDFNNLGKYTSELVADDIFCCLGTTIKQAGSKEAFYKVDYTYVTQLAKITAAKNATQFLVVSALGANSSSFIFYNKVKGEMEQFVKQQDFSAVHIFQPSLLLGERDDERAGEKLASKVMTPLSALMVGPLKKYRPIEAETVASAMVYTASLDQKGIYTYPSDAIARLGTKL